MAQLSIVIPTLNEELFIGALLESIAQQTTIPKEVLLVDCGSADKTVEIAESFKGRLPLTIMHWSRGISVQRNAGGNAAKGDIILFLDADAEIDPTFVEHACREFTERKLDVACSYFYIDKSRRLIDRFGGWLISRYHGLFQYRKNPMCSGFCIFITPEMFKKLGGFNETFLHSEDHDIAWRAVRNGARFRMIHAPYRLSNRRYEEQGRFSLLMVYAWAEINRIFFRYKFAPREKPIYEFGIFVKK